MTSQEVLEAVAKSLVITGVYKNEEAAIKALAIEQIERKILTYQNQVQQFERRYQHTLEKHTRTLEGKASMEEEDEWMEWKGAEVMLDAWQKALQDILHSGN